MIRTLLLALAMSTACASTSETSKDVHTEKTEEPSSRNPADLNSDAPEVIQPAGEAEVEPEQKPEAARQKSPPPGVKIKGNLPVRTESELAAEASARDTCQRDCVKSRQMQAKGADAIEADCHQSCQQQHPIVQVEVVQDGPIE